MVARNPMGYLGGLIILTSDKKKSNLYVRLYTQPRSHYTARPSVSTAMGLGPIAGFSARGVTVPSGIRSPDLPFSRRDLYRRRCLGPRNPSARSIYLPFRLEWRGLKHKKNLQDSKPGRGHGKAGPYLPGHWRLGFNVWIPGPVPVNRLNQNLGN